MKQYNPPHPGEFIFETYLEPFGHSARSLAKAIGTDPTTVCRLLKGESGISPAMAHKLSAALGRTPESWMMMQTNHDLWEAAKDSPAEGIQRLEFV